MQFEANLDELAAAAAAAAAAADRRALQPVTSGIRIDADDDGLHLTGTCYDITGRAHVPAFVTKPGSVLVPGAFFAQITAGLPAGKPFLAELDSDAAIVRVTCGRAKFTMPVMPLADFPTMPPMPPVIGTVPAGEFCDALPTLLHSLTTEDALPALMSVHFEVGAATLTMVATDRYRIPISVVTIARDTTDEIPPFLIRGKLLDALVKSAAGGNDKITLAVSTGTDGKVDLIGFSDGRKEITGRASQLEYVKWRTYIKPTETAAVISAAELTGAVKRCQIANDKGSKLPLALTFRDGSLVVSASQPGGFAGEETVEQVRFNGEDGTCYYFKASYLLDGIAGTHRDYLRIAFGPTPLKPVIITGADIAADPASDPADPAYQYVLMPVRNTG